MEASIQGLFATYFTSTLLIPERTSSHMHKILAFPGNRAIISITCWKISIIPHSAYQVLLHITNTTVKPQAAKLFASGDIITTAKIARLPKQISISLLTAL